MMNTEQKKVTDSLVAGESSEISNPPSRTRSRANRYVVINAKPISNIEHSTLAGLRQRLQDTAEACEKCIAYLDNSKKWRVVASHIADMQSDLETAEQQINELL